MSADDVSNRPGFWEEIKTCAGCRLPLPHSAYTWKLRGRQLASYCRLCLKDHRRQRYVQHKKAYIARAARYQKTVIRSWYVALKEKTPCADCGKFYHHCQMDFDHLRDKKFRLAGGYLKRGRRKMMQEMAKCELVCANCHRMRTFLRRQQADGPCGREPTSNSAKEGSTPSSVITV